MVYISLDWLSLVGSLSIGEVLDKFGISLDSDLMHFYENTKGLEEKVVLDINGIRFEVSRSVFFGHVGNDFDLVIDDDGNACAKGDLLHVIWDRLKVDFSGTALRWLRSCGFDVDHLFQDEHFFADHSRYHLTRTDLAIDFVNVCPDLLENLIMHCMECKLNGIDRLNTGRQSGVSFRVISSGVGGSVVLGSNQSPLRLEYYDKRAEQKIGTVFAKPLPPAFVEFEPVDLVPGEDDICHTRIDSWIRCELRARQASACNWAESVLFSKYHPDRDSDFNTPYGESLGNLESVILIVRDRFWVRGLDGVVLPCLAEAFSEKNLFANFKLYEIRGSKVLAQRPIDEAARAWMNRYFLIFVKLFVYFGKDRLVSELNHMLSDLYKSDKPSAHKSYSRLISAISSMLCLDSSCADNYKIIVDQLIAIK